MLALFPAEIAGQNIISLSAGKKKGTGLSHAPRLYPYSRLYACGTPDRARHLLVADVHSSHHRTSRWNRCATTTPTTTTTTRSPYLRERLRLRPRKSYRAPCADAKAGRRAAEMTQTWPAPQSRFRAGPTPARWRAARPRASPSVGALRRTLWWSAPGGPPPHMPTCRVPRPRATQVTLLKTTKCKNVSESMQNLFLPAWPFSTSSVRTRKKYFFQPLSRTRVSSATVLKDRVQARARAFKGCAQRAACHMQSSLCPDRQTAHTGTPPDNQGSIRGLEWIRAVLHERSA